MEMELGVELKLKHNLEQESLEHEVLERAWEQGRELEWVQGLKCNLDLKLKRGLHLDL